MTSLQSSTAMPAPGKASAGRDLCPWCGQPVTHDRFEAITAQIAAKERERVAQIERGLRERLVAEKTAIEAAARAEIAAAQRDAAAAVAAATKAAAASELRGRAEAKAQAEAAAAARIASAETARKTAVEQLAAAKASTDAAIAEQLRAQRETLDAANLVAVNAEKAKAFADRQKLEEKLAAMQRQLQQKTATELGEGAEVDLFEALRAEFPEDRFNRVKKGAQGADIVHEVIHNGRICGRIVYDAKNRDAWRNDYATKTIVPHERDFGIIKRQEQADNGEKVVAMVDKAMTLKKFYKRKDHVRLEPCNSGMDPIIVDPNKENVSVLGVPVAAPFYPACLSAVGQTA